MSGDIVTSPICIVPHSSAWHQASHSLTFCRFVWLGGAEPFTSHSDWLITETVGSILRQFAARLTRGTA